MDFIHHSKKGVRGRGDFDLFASKWPLIFFFFFLDVTYARHYLSFDYLAKKTV